MFVCLWECTVLHMHASINACVSGYQCIYVWAGYLYVWLYVCQPNVLWLWRACVAMSLSICLYACTQILYVQKAVLIRYVYAHVSTKKYTNIYIYMYVCMHLYIYAGMCIYVCIFVYVYAYARICACSYVCTYVCMCACLCGCMHTRLHLFMRIFMHLYWHATSYLQTCPATKTVTPIICLSVKLCNQILGCQSFHVPRPFWTQAHLSWTECQFGNPDKHKLAVANAAAEALKYTAEHITLAQPWCPHRHGRLPKTVRLIHACT